MRIIGLALVVAFAGMAGCIGDEESSTGATLYVKDLPTDVDNVFVTFTSAQVASNGAWMDVFDGKETIDLLALNASDAKAKLASFDLAPGTYDGMRIAVSEVTVVVNGSEELFNVFGNLVEISEGFVINEDGTTDIVVDFDLDEGLDLEAMTYTPVVADIQTSNEDSDGDGINDVLDTDDDNDGIEDADDDDDDGDGKADKPKQDLGNYWGICKAQERHDMKNTTSNGTAFQKLERRAAEDGRDVKEFCAAQMSHFKDKVDECQAEAHEERADLNRERKEHQRERMEEKREQAQEKRDARGQRDAMQNDTMETQEVDAEFAEDEAEIKEDLEECLAEAREMDDMDDADDGSDADDADDADEADDAEEADDADDAVDSDDADDTDDADDSDNQATETGDDQSSS